MFHQDSMKFEMTDGFHAANGVMLEDLTKALQAGYGTDSASMTGGRALIPQSLDKTLVNVLWSQDEAKLFKALKKEPVQSTVHEYVKRSGVGDSDGAWVSEGGDSVEKNQTIARKTLSMKYLQTLRKVTLQMASTNSIEDAEALEANAGTLWLIQQIERGLFRGNSGIVAEQPDGLSKLIPAANVIDLRGKTAADSEFEDAMIAAPRRIRENYGKADILMASPAVFEDVQKLLRDRLRVPAEMKTEGNAGSYVFDTYPTSFGKVRLEDNIFIAPEFAPRASTITANRPGQPTFTLAAAPDAASQFVAADAGDYYYKLVGVNKYGDSVESAAVLATAVAAGDKVTLTITVASTNATGYKVYRSTKGGAATTCKLMVEVDGISALPTSIVDLNANLPGTYEAYVGVMAPTYDTIEWNQFLPLMRFPLYPTNAAVYPFLMLLFGALNLKKEEQWVKIKNIGYAGSLI